MLTTSRYGGMPYRSCLIKGHMVAGGVVYVELSAAGVTLMMIGYAPAHTRLLLVTRANLDQLL
ncbi:hypothetical protein BD309DRAFT_960396, partial [Dichomitus squalens]